MYNIKNGCNDVITPVGVLNYSYMLFFELNGYQSL